MLTSFADDEALFSAIMAGAAGYVLKQVRGTDLVDGVRRVGRGRVAPRPVARPPGSSSACASRRSADELAGLTDQERRILDLIAEGMTNRQIGEQLFLAEKTVKNYVSNLLAKLGMSRRTEAAAYAARLSERRQHDQPRAEVDAIAQSGLTPWRSAGPRRGAGCGPRSRARSSTCWPGTNWPSRPPRLTRRGDG